jgi:bacillithiol biosynthesis cysteine-adding enzyme BshC
VKIQQLTYPPKSISSFLRDSAWDGNPSGLYPAEGVQSDIAQIKSALQIQFNASKRAVLYQVLKDQLQDRGSEQQKLNLERLLSSNGYVVATGQQIHIGLGPAYVLYKIVSAIVWAKKLKVEHPEDHFVPVFWMATEDHDVAEINHVDIQQDRYHWDCEWFTSVGDMPTQSLDGMFDWLQEKLGKSDEAKAKIETARTYFSKPSATLSTAMNEWVSDLFGEFGLLVLDPRDLRLKQLAQPLFEKALLDSSLLESFRNSTELLKAKGIEPPAHVGQSLVFWMDAHRRSRIEKLNEVFETIDGGKHWTPAEMNHVLNSDALRCLSANVLLRPLYQQAVLPCVTYVAGPSEYLYWLQTPEGFKTANLVAPQLIHRKGGVVLTQSQMKKINRLELSPLDCFLGIEGIKQELMERTLGENALNASILSVDAALQQQLKTLYHWNSPLLSEVKKEINKFVKWQKGMGKAAVEAHLESQFSAESWRAIEGIINTHLSVSQPQERSAHWVQWYILYGNDWIKALCNSVDYDSIQSYWWIEL